MKTMSFLPICTTYFGEKKDKPFLSIWKNAFLAHKEYICHMFFDVWSKNHISQTKYVAKRFDLHCQMHHNEDAFQIH